MGGTLAGWKYLRRVACPLSLKSYDNVGISQRDNFVVENSIQEYEIVARRYGYSNMISSRPNVVYWVLDLYLVDLSSLPFEI